MDVVASNGLAWIKVVARNPDALLTSSLGDGEYGRRTILDQVRDMVDCAGCHPHLYRIPEVKIWTALPVGEPLREIIEGVGAEVCLLSSYAVFGAHLRLVRLHRIPKGSPSVCARRRRRGVTSLPVVILAVSQRRERQLPVPPQVAPQPGRQRRTSRPSVSFAGISATNHQDRDGTTCWLP